MRILHVTLAYTPADSFGGPVKSVRVAANKLARRGHDVTVVCTNWLSKTQDYVQDTDEREIDGVRVVRLKTFRFRRWPGTIGPYWAPRFREFLRSELPRTDIIHAHDCFRDSFSATIAGIAGGAGVPYLLQPRGCLPLGTNFRFAKRVVDILFERRVLDGAAAVVTLTPSEASQAIAVGVNSERIHMIPNAIDRSIYGALPKKGALRAILGLAPEIPLILFLARINAKKGLDTLIEALARMSVPAHLAVVGGDDNDGHSTVARAVARRVGVEQRVHWVGLWKGQSVLEPLADADVFALSCRVDTFPMAVVEACYMGVPIVLSNTCEIADIVGPAGAVVVNPTPIEFGAALDRVLLDVELRRKLSCGARLVAQEHFSVTQLGDRLERLYALVR